MIAALFVAKDGPYFNLSGVEPWDELRDAKNYSGPYKVIAHPPCERWGRYWAGGPSAKNRKKLGDDNGCFKSALASVRKYGGIIEHPEGSHAWPKFGLTKPPKKGGWIIADELGGKTCCVEQGHYGHKARKATWLYAFEIATPELIWGKAENKMRCDEGFHSSLERMAARAQGKKPIKRLNQKERVHTPIEFRDLLISLVKDPTHDR